MNKTDKGLEVAKLFKEVLLMIRHNVTKAIKNSELTLPQGILIGILSKCGKMKINELSNKLSLSNSTVSGIIDRLEKRGIVERIRSNDDKRVVYVTLTSKFEEIKEQLPLFVENNIQNIINKGTSEELDQITLGLSTLKKLLSEG